MQPLGCHKTLLQLIFHYVPMNLFKISLIRQAHDLSHSPVLVSMIYRFEEELLLHLPTFDYT